MPNKAKAQKNLTTFIGSWKSREANQCPAIAKISWLDACIHNGGQLQCSEGWRDGYKPGVWMETIGYVLFADKDWVTVAMERNAEQGCQYFRDWQDIPRYSIGEFKVLQKAK
jgi:hypothetical protein